MEKKKQRTQNLVEGSMVLAVATLIVKILGAIYKIPLASLLGGGLGSGYYNTAYEIYLPVYSLAMAGLPVAVSRMVAESVAQKRYRDARKILKVAQRAFLVTGTVGTLVILGLIYLCLFRPSVQNLIGIDPNNVYATVLISFSVLFCCIMSSYRGYYEGLRNMYPTAVSQVIEGAGKLVVGLVMAGSVRYVCMEKFGMTSAQTAPFSAAGAILGVTLGSVVGAVYLILRHRMAGDGFTEEDLAASPEPQSSKALLKAMIAIAVPIVIGSMVRDVAGLIDLFTVQSRLKGVLTASPDLIVNQYGVLPRDAKTIGEQVTWLYGCYKQYAYSLYNLIPTITSVIGVSTIPTLCTAWAKKDAGETSDCVHSILKLTSVISLPAGIGIAVLAGPILNLLFVGSPNEVTVATPVLVVLGVSAIFSGIAVPTTSMLQAIGKQNIPVINMAIGVVLKVSVNFLLVGIPSVNVIGAPAGTGVCYAYIMVANLIALKKHAKVSLGVWASMMKPALCSAACGFSAWGGMLLLRPVLGSGKAATALCIILAAIVYAICLGISKTFTEKDILMLPKGEKMVKILAKLHWIG